LNPRPRVQVWRLSWCSPPFDPLLSKIILNVFTAMFGMVILLKAMVLWEAAVDIWD